jgi:hypothetical protein
MHIFYNSYAYTEREFLRRKQKFGPFVRQIDSLFTYTYIYISMYIYEFIHVYFYTGRRQLHTKQK